MTLKEIYDTEMMLTGNQQIVINYRENDDFTFSGTLMCTFTSKTGIECVNLMNRITPVKCESITSITIKG